MLGAGQLHSTYYHTYHISDTNIHTQPAKTPTINVGRASVNPGDIIRVGSSPWVLV